MIEQTIVKVIAREVTRLAPTSASTFMFQSLINIDMLTMRPVSVQRGGLEFLVGRSILYGDFWSSIGWEENTYRIMKEYLRNDKSCIDIGAWVGPTVLYEAQLAKHTYAIEPDPVALRYLRKNLELNPELNERTTVIDACIGEVDGLARLGMSNLPGDSESSLLFDTSRISWPVKSMKLDTLIEKHGIGDCNFVKMDIEGGEFMVLPTMAGFLRREKPTLCLSIHPWMSDNLKRDFAAVTEILQGYRRVFSDDGSPIDIDAMKNGASPTNPTRSSATPRNMVIVATDEKNVPGLQNP